MHQRKKLNILLTARSNQKLSSKQATLKFLS